MLIQQRPSPNHSARPDGVVVDTIVLHADAAAQVSSSLDWMRRPESRVSYHYLLGRTGSVYQLVPESRRAWHAGVSEFEGRKNVNDFSISVSLSNRNDGLEPYPTMQLDAAAILCAEIIHRHPAITLERITTHYAISPGRKTDPAPPFRLSDFLADVAKRLGPPR